MVQQALGFKPRRQSFWSVYLKMKSAINEVAVVYYLQFISYGCLHYWGNLPLRA